MTRSRARFVQQITPLPRGRVSYLLQTVNGPIVEHGTRLSEYFAAAHDWIVETWTVTHLPSGMFVGFTRTLKEARRHVAAIQQVVPDAQVRALTPGADARTILATIREATGGWPEPLRRVS